MFPGTLVATGNKTINVEMSFPQSLQARKEIGERNLDSRSVLGAGASRVTPWMWKKKMNSKQVNFLLEALVKNKVEPKNCPMKLLHVYPVLDFVRGWPLTSMGRGVRGSHVAVVL